MVRALEIPTRDSQSTFDACVARVKDEDTGKALKALSPVIAAAEPPYILRAKAGQLISTPPVRQVEKYRQRMVQLYTNILAKKRSSLRHIYDELRASAKGDICPLCAQRTVSTLDHYLEKVQHPAYAVAPINLVPSCAECNKVRATLKGTSPAEQTLHPYFDNVDDGRWLKAEVIHGKPPVIKYRVAKPQGWVEIKWQRTQFHFNGLGLGRLYSTQAAVELINIRYALHQIGEQEGAGGVRRHLVEQAKSRLDAFKNSWQTAMYEAIATSAWFCATGYLQIPEAE